jgi:hypothetical protein
MLLSKNEAWAPVMKWPTRCIPTFSDERRPILLIFMFVFAFGSLVRSLIPLPSSWRILTSVHDQRSSKTKDAGCMGRVYE